MSAAVGEVLGVLRSRNAKSLAASLSTLVIPGHLPVIGGVPLCPAADRMGSP